MKAVDRILGEAMTPWQKRIHKNPEKAVKWAIKNRKRFPEAEAAIATSLWAYEYARYVIKDRWPEGEEAIAKSPSHAYNYAMHVIKGRWPEAEEAIATSLWAYEYAHDVIKGRWPEGEAAIAKDPLWAYLYALDVIKGRWPEAEEAIANSNNRDVYLKLFPDAKDDWALNGWIDWLDT